MAFASPILQKRTRGTIAEGDVGSVSLAVVVYEAVTGAMPFPVDSARDWRQAILAGSFSPVTSYIPDAPRSWQTFFADCFSTDKSQRPSSVTEFIRRLENTFRAWP